jgi:streptothricin acetyltransferase
VDDKLAGEVRLAWSWNKYALLDSFVVDEKYRRRGVGRALMERAIVWARDHKFPGLTLETQNTNVPACKLYESCGFELRGFDTHLYKALDPSTDEIALFWYLVF